MRYGKVSLCHEHLSVRMQLRTEFASQTPICLYYITVTEHNVFVFSASGFKTDFTGFSPIAPGNAVFHADVFHVHIGIGENALDHDRIVEGVDKGVFDKKTRDN